MPDNRLMRKVMQRYWRFARAHTLGAQGMVLDPQNRVLLVRHGYRSGWHFPGGGVEKNENVALALERELLEEVGVVITAPPQLLGIYANFQAFPSDHVVVFVVRAWQRPKVSPPNREIVEQGFFAHHELPLATSDGTRRRLAEVLDGTPASVTW